MAKQPFLKLENCKKNKRVSYYDLLLLTDHLANEGLFGNVSLINLFNNTATKDRSVITIDDTTASLITQDSLKVKKAYNFQQRETIRKLVVNRRYRCFIFENIFALLGKHVDHDLTGNFYRFLVKNALSPLNEESAMFLEDFTPYEQLLPNLRKAFDIHAKIMNNYINNRCLDLINKYVSENIKKEEYKLVKDKTGKEKKIAYANMAAALPLKLEKAERKDFSAYFFQYIESYSKVDYCYYNRSREFKGNLFYFMDMISRESTENIITLYRTIRILYKKKAFRLTNKKLSCTNRSVFSLNKYFIRG